MAIKNKFITIFKVFLYFILFIMITLFSVSVYQEIAHQQEYSYFNLWNFKTREKVFQKDSSTVRLVGMIHIANEKYYEDIVSTPRIRESIRNGKIITEKTVTLMEGVSNKSKDQSAPSLNYQGLSKNLNLVSQKGYTNKFPNVVQSDVDFADFSMETKGDLDSISKLLQILIDFSDKKISYSQLTKSLESQKDSLNKAGDSLRNGNLKKEILSQRNDYLWSQIQKYKNEGYTTIIIPWGADHLLDVETRLISEGYLKTESIEYTALNVILVLKEVSSWFVTP